MENPLIGMILGQTDKHIAKFEFASGCGCSNMNCVDLKRQESMYISKDDIRKCVKARKLTKYYIWVIACYLFGRTVALYTCVYFEILNYSRMQHAIESLMTIGVMYLFSLILYTLYAIIIDESVKKAATFSAIRYEYCNECIVYATCVQACPDYCNHISNEHLHINLQVKDMQMIGEDRSYDRIEERLKNYLTFL